MSGEGATFVQINSGENPQQNRANINDFTARRNWWRVLDEVKDLLHVVSDNGKIMFCSTSSLELVGFSPEELVGRNLRDFVHVDDVDSCTRGFNLAAEQRCITRLYYRFRKRDDKFALFEVTVRPYFDPDSNNLRCYFNMGRLYPTEACHTIDSLLELKLENEKLRKQLNDLISTRKKSDASTASVLQQESLANTTLDITGEGDAGFDVDSDFLQMLTGLRYRSGERSLGISRGLPDSSLLDSYLSDLPETSVGLIGQDIAQTDEFLANITKSTPISSNTLQSETALEGTRARKKKKQRGDTEEEHICTECGTTDSPEWRKGPSGPKT
ncbi:uncharacterized protein VTP21DRAFT_3963 [Calcarisporiella thermophila]|uniref:uncharacterized protein n=1 Tax=Calcarisporiella thermophila TaxID=911321 RepID=UPI003743403E